MTSSGAFPGPIFLHIDQREKSFGRQGGDWLGTKTIQDPLEVKRLFYFQQLKIWWSL